MATRASNTSGFESHRLAIRTFDSMAASAAADECDEQYHSQKVLKRFFIVRPQDRETVRP